MSVGLKSIGIIGAGAVLAMEIAGSASVPANNSEVKAVQPTSQVNVAAPAAVLVPTPKPTPKAPVSNCHSGYSGCLKKNAGDYDCAGGSGNGPNYTGRVEVYGSDPFDLDRDGDGVGCER